MDDHRCPSLNNSIMIQGYGPVTQALLGTLLTWGLTALGSAMVIFLRGNQVRLNSHSNFRFVFLI